LADVRIEPGARLRMLCWSRRVELTGDFIIENAGFSRFSPTGAWHRFLD
jgi:hypothetical protein